MLGLPLGVPVLVRAVFPAEELDTISLVDKLKDGIALILKDSRLDIGVGLIKDLKCQPEFEIIPQCGKERAAKYHADFSYIDSSGALVVEDVKSRATKTRDYILRRKLMNWRFGIQVKEV